MKGIGRQTIARSALGTLLSISFILIAVLSVRAQTDAEKAPQRIARARALAALGNLTAAASELEALRGAAVDDSVREVTRILLVGIYLEQGEHKRAEALLDECFKARSAENDASLRAYYALAGQTINGIRTHLNRYRTFGLNIADHGLPAEAAADLDHLRTFLDRIIEQARSVGKENAKSSDATALLEDAASVRLTLARNDQERAQWQREVSEVRQQLVASETRIASISAAPVSGPVATPTPSPTPSSSPAPAKPSGASEARSGGLSTASSAPNRSPTNSNASIRTTAAPSRLSAPPAGRQQSSAGTSSGNPPRGKAGATGMPPVAIGSLHNMATQKITPTYPPPAKLARVSGTVTVFLVVNEKGAVETVERTNGPNMLQGAAVDAARRWKFRPTVVSGQPVRVSGFLNFNFSL